MNYSDNKDKKFNLMAATGVAGGTSIGWLAPLLMAHNAGERRELLANIKKIRSDNSIDRMLNKLDERVLKIKTKKPRIRNVQGLLINPASTTAQVDKINKEIAIQKLKDAIIKRNENIQRNLQSVRGSYTGLKSSGFARLIRRLISKVKK